MKRKYSLIFTLFFGVISFGTANANLLDDGHTFDKGLFELGYKTIESSVYECENLFNEKVVLPYQIPPVPFTHYVGRCNKDYGINNSFEILYLNEKIPKNHYSLTLRPKKHAIKFKSDRIDKTIKLDKGIAYFVTNSASNNLIFERGEWQYILATDKRISEQVPLEVLVDIANAF